MISLEHIASQTGENKGCGLVFNTFRDDFHAKAVGQINRGSKDEPIARAGRDVQNQGSVDLQFIGGYLLQIAER